MTFGKGDEDSRTDNEIVNAFKLDTDHLFQKDRNVRCAPDTGLWFFDHPEYQAFRDEKGPQLLFVTAEAGGGKSTIMRTFLDRLQLTGNRPIVIFYFFKDDDDQLRSYEDALSSMVHQLLVQERGLTRHVRDLYKRHRHGIRYQTKELWNFLKVAAAETYREVICVLDAVDECAPAGRRQLLSDLAFVFSSGATIPLPTKLKCVLTSRPYLDENHPYADLVAPNIIRHLVGEDAKVQTDVQEVIRFNVEVLARKYQLSQESQRILIESIANQNLQTRSFIAVRMAFELLDSHDLMHEGVEEDIVRAILADIPQSLGDQFDKMLDKSTDKEHARRLFCVILSARKTLKIPELKVLYALTKPRGNTSEPPHSYNDLQIPSDDQDFRRLIRARCGLFVTFVRSSVHLFHQTAREYLMAHRTATGDHPLNAKVSSELSSQQHHQHTWEGSITQEYANLVMFSVCADLFKFEVSKSWVLSVFDSLNAGNDFEKDIQAYLKDKPVFQYAALNWYEHAILGGRTALSALQTVRYASILDISNTSFWAWFLVLADYMGSSSSRPEAPLADIWQKAYKQRGLGQEYGRILRDICLKKLFKMHYSMYNLLAEPSLPLQEATTPSEGPAWSAFDGYDLIDQFLVAFGEYEHTSFSKAVQCIESGQIQRGMLLAEKMPSAIMIWTCISTGAPLALKTMLASVADIDWLHQVPEHLMYKRKPWKGYSTRTGEALRKDRGRGWTEPWPPCLPVIYSAIKDYPNAEVLSNLANWVTSSDHAEDHATQFWDAGGFLEPRFCRRLANAGAAVNRQFQYGSFDALRIAATLWEHDAVDTLLELGADPTLRDSHGQTALQKFLSGPTDLFKVDGSSHLAYSRKSLKHLSEWDQRRLRKSRISSTLQALSSTLFRQSPLDQADASGKYPLMLAVQSSQTATEGLLRAAANIHQRDRWGRTALMHYFRGNLTGRSPKTLRLLLEAGANNSVSDASGHTVLQYWARQVFAMDLSSLYPGFNRFNKTFEILTTYGELSEPHVLTEQMAWLNFPLSAAARLGNAKLCWHICMAGTHPDKHGLSINNRLAENCGSEAMRLEELGWKPLLIALMHKAYTTAAILLAYGADVKFRTRSRQRTKYNKYSMKTCGTTALHIAVQGDFGTNYSSRTSLQTGGFSGCSFLAVGNPVYEIAKISSDTLLGRYAIQQYEKSDWQKRRFKDESSDSEYELPKTRVHNDNTGDKLLPYDALSKSILPSVSTKLDDPLYFKVIDQDLAPSLRQNALVELLLEKGASVNAKTQEGTTPLSLVSSDNPGLARILLKYGADPNLASKNGLTPLMKAAQRDDRELVDILLTAGADPNTQLNVVSLRERQCSSFIQRGTFTFHQCDAPLTALALAAERGYYEIVKLLLDHGADPNQPIEHHAHGRVPSSRDKRRRARRYGEPDSSDSEVEPEEWKGYKSVGTALSWARDEVRELLLQNGAVPEKEMSVRECRCAVIEKRKEPKWNDSADEWPTHSEGEDSDAHLRRPRFDSIKARKGAKWDGDTD